MDGHNDIILEAIKSRLRYELFPVVSLMFSFHIKTKNIRAESHKLIKGQDSTWRETVISS